VIQVSGAAQLDHPVAAIAQRTAELAIVVGSWRRIVSGAIDEDADPGQAVAREIEVDLDREICSGQCWA
jgi:hypothetical protein